MRTRDQEYAIHAYEKVSAIKDAAERTSYGSMAHKLPILIRTAGLAQALSFVETRGKEAQKRLLSDLGETIGRQNLAGIARSAELTEYMLLTRQVMDALLWYKRFAQSVLGVEASDTTLEEVGGPNEQPS